MTALLTSGQIDGAWICGYPFVSHRTELQLLAVPQWHGRPLYRSLAICDADREASDLTSLRGDVHAIGRPDLLIVEGLALFGLPFAAIRRYIRI